MKKALLFRSLGAVNRLPSLGAVNRLPFARRMLDKGRLASAKADGSTFGLAVGRTPVRANTGTTAVSLYSSPLDPPRKSSCHEDVSCASSTLPYGTAIFETFNYTLIYK